MFAVILRSNQVLISYIGLLQSSCAVLHYMLNAHNFLLSQRVNHREHSDNDNRGNSAWLTCGYVCVCVCVCPLNSVIHRAYKSLPVIPVPKDKFSDTLPYFSLGFKLILFSYWVFQAVILNVCHVSRSSHPKFDLPKNILSQILTCYIL